MTAGRALLAAAAVLLAWAVRAPALARPYLGFDGGLSVALAASPMRELLELSARDVHPPLYYLALGAWWRLAGPSPFVALWTSLALAALAVAAAWSLGSLAGTRTSALAALLLALNPLHAHDGMAVRDFAALVPVALLAAALLVRWLRSPTVFLAWVLGVVYCVGLLASYYAAPLAAAHGLVASRSRALRRWLPLALPGLLLLAGWGTITAWQIGPALLSGARATPGQPPALGLTAVELLAALPGGKALPMAGALAWAIVLVAGRTWVRGQLATIGWTALLLSLTTAATTVTFWLGDAAPTRYALVLLPHALTLVALGAATRWPAALALLPSLAGLWLTREPPALPTSFFDPIGLTRALDQASRPGDAVAFISLEQAGYYAAISQSPRPWRVIPVGPRYLEGDLSAEAARKLDPMIGAHERLYLVLYHGGIGAQHGHLRERLGTVGFPAGDAALADGSVELYLAPKGQPRGLAVPWSASFPGVALEAVELTVGPELGVTLYWRAEGPLSKQYRVFVHLLDERGAKVAQHDAAPANGLRPTHAWQPGEQIVDRHGLPLVPGATALLIGLYDDEGRLRTRDGSDSIRLNVPDL